MPPPLNIPALTTIAAPALRAGQILQLVNGIQIRNAAPEQLVRVDGVVGEAEALVDAGRVPAERGRPEGVAVVQPGPISLAVQHVVRGGVVGHVDEGGGQDRVGGLVDAAVADGRVDVDEVVGDGRTVPDADAAGVRVDVVQVRIVRHVDVAVVGAAEIAIKVHGVEHQTIITVEIRVNA